MYYMSCKYNSIIYTVSGTYKHIVMFFGGVGEFHEFCFHGDPQMFSPQKSDHKSGHGDIREHSIYSCKLLLHVKIVSSECSRHRDGFLQVTSQTKETFILRNK